MISRKTSESLRQLALQGASLEVDGARFTSESLRVLALALKPGAHLKICNSDKFTTDSLSTIALAKPGQVIFA